MSLYFQYVKELTCGRDIIEIDNVGFITYCVHPDQIYIEDTYVLPEHRNGLIFKSLFDQIVDIAKGNNLNVITHDIAKAHSDFDKMERRSLRYGFKKLCENETECSYMKELSDG